jgi:hypothetical protein
MLPTTETFTSTTHPAITYTLKRIGLGLRRDIQLRTASNNLRQRVLSAELDNLLPKESDAPDAPRSEPKDIESKTRVYEIEAEQLQLLVDERIEWFKNICVAIHDTSDDSVINPLDVLNCGPEDLFGEINDKVLAYFGLTAEQSKNSPRPSTSPLVEDGPTPPTNAENASEDATT